MKEKSLKAKAVDIKGKEYILVKDRVLYFNEQYPEGCIRTFLLTEPLETTIVIKATVFPDANNVNKYFNGHAQEVIGDGYINKSSAMENAETSAVGRALAMMGIGVLDSIASVDEINKAKNRETIDIKDFDPETERVGFGKHADLLWCDVPPHYLNWLVENGKPEAKQKATLTLSDPADRSGIEVDDIIRERN